MPLLLFIIVGAGFANGMLSPPFESCHATVRLHDNASPATLWISSSSPSWQQPRQEKLFVPGRHAAP